MPYSVDVQTRGPVFDGRAAHHVTLFLQAATQAVAEEGEKDVHGKLQGSLRHPTGYYESNVTVDPRGATDHVITDSGVIYGPWLEGTGSRNATTRFKGYHSFRRATQELDRKARYIALRVLDRYVRMMNS